MRRSPIIFIALLLVLMVTVFSACEFSIDIGKNKETTTTPAEDSTGNTEETVTVFVDETDENGKVIGTKAEILSASEVNKGKDFYSASDSTKLTSGISSERLDNTDDETAKDDNSIISSKKYVINGRIVKDGVTSEYRIAQNGTKYALMTSYNGTPIGIISGAENLYIIQPNDKTYIEIPRSLFEGADGSNELTAALNGDFGSSNKKVKSKGTEKVDGKKLSYTEYDDGSRNYYSGNTLVMSKSTDGSVVYYDEISTDVSEALFSPPTGYTSVPLTAESLSSFSGVIEGESDTTAAK